MRLTLKFLIVKDMVELREFLRIEAQCEGSS